MFGILIYTTAAMVAVAMAYAYAGSRDVFHPVMFIGPMMAFMYVWMPLRLDSIGGLDGFFQRDQLNFVQTLNALGVACFLVGCLSVGCRLPPVRWPALEISTNALLAGGIIAGLMGLAAWIEAIRNVGGLVAAFSQSYSGGWDDNGYIRDGSLLMFPGFLLILSAALQEGFKLSYLLLMMLFLAPWSIQAAFTARRGPTFMIAAIVTLGWYLSRGKRPSLPMAAAAGVSLGFLMLFLVVNRSSIYLGSDKDVTSDVAGIVDTPDTGNEYIYGAGSILSSDQRHSYYWGRRYLAQVLIRPIPHTLWPTKYEDFGLPELTHNAGTGEGFEETLGWEGAEGSAPGIVADLWVELWWFNLPALFFLGRIYGKTWRRAVLQGGMWVAQYTILSALSIYFVMQTMEAVIFRVLILSLPLRLTWHLARQPQAPCSLVPHAGHVDQIPA